MMNTANAPAGQKKPDGTLTTQTETQTLIMQVFFNHDSDEISLDMFRAKYQSSSLRSTLYLSRDVLILQQLSSAII
jgi:hypothetical protein